MFFGIPHKPMPCDMRTLLSCLHHAPNTPSFALFCSYRSHQQRSKRALQTVVYHRLPVPRICMSRIYPPPPLYRCICEHPSSPEFFFIFFLHPIFLPDFLKFFILILCCDILRYLSGLICKIILFIIVMMFALYVDVFAMQCVYEPLSLYS